MNNYFTFYSFLEMSLFFSLLTNVCRLIRVVCFLGSPYFISFIFWSMNTSNFTINCVNIIFDLFTLFNLINHKYSLFLFIITI